MRVCGKVGTAVELRLVELRQFQRNKSWQVRMFSHKTNGQPLDDPKEVYRVQCFCLMLDQAIMSLECSFEQVKIHVKLFVFLNNFQRKQTVEIRINAALADTTTKQISDGEVVTLMAICWLKNL